MDNVKVSNKGQFAAAAAFPKTRVEDGLGMLARKDRKRLGDEQTRRAIGTLLKDRDEATKR